MKKYVHGSTLETKSERRERLLSYQWNYCSNCGYDLDTGWECNRCGFDARPFALFWKNISDITIGEDK